jgi:lysophospholipase L1-like esterase
MLPDTPDAGRNAGPSKNAGWLAALLANMLILTVSILVSLLIAEAGFRLSQGVSLVDGKNWRMEGVRTKRIGDRAIYDPVLGWTLQPGYRSDGFNTIGEGVRRNFDETEVRTGAILAVGDSFTEGFEEVDDAGTWPAHLEKLIGQPVVNAGVAGYATDQIVLRAERLLPVIKPKTLLIGFTDADIERAAMSEAGAPKPYFTVENEKLVYHPPAPLDPPIEESALGSALRSVLGHSALANHLLSRLAPKFWYPREADVYEEVENDAVAVTCLLLRRLKQTADKRQTRLLLFLQYGGDAVLNETGIGEDMQLLTECAQQAGIEVADQFQSLKALTQGNPDRVAEYYVFENDEYGHMTSKGNAHAAELLAKALKEGSPLNAALEKTGPLPN